MLFVTSNRHKFEEAKKIIPELEMRELDIPEPRGGLKEIAMGKALYAFNIIKKPLVVEDTGIFIDCLNGFPGEMAKWSLQKLGLKGILKLMEGCEKRTGRVLSVVAYIDSEGIRLFEGALEVEIAKEPRGTSGFGYDPILIPKGKGFTLAENTQYKHQHSHRVEAFKKLQAYLKKNRG
ncbi:MAG: non-canonical purine NTP pyrophosphatase [Candidatus Micrarchaeota archaeon]|nr:non-canonical purine NTP pyrophosphatase [Candidatus Micrarchaeota archaeon]